MNYVCALPVFFAHITNRHDVDNDKPFRITTHSLRPRDASGQQLHYTVTHRETYQI